MPRKGTGSRPFLLVLAASSFVGVARGEFPDYPMTFTEMKIIAGYYTEGGKYLGGIPKADDLSKEIYECVNDDYFYPTMNDTNSNATDAAGDATVCMEWRADESAGGTFQQGSCECKFVDNEAYCSAWVCVQVKEVEDCNSGGSCYVSTNTDSVLCQCDLENISGLYCDSWSCKQIDSEGREEFEEYHCQREAASGHYCEAWNGNVTASDEIEVVTCECVATWNGDRVCSYWECEELGLNICASSARHWCDLSYSIGLGGVFGLAGVVAVSLSVSDLCQQKHATHGAAKLGVVIVGLSGILWCLLWSIGVVIWGGVAGATYVGIMWGSAGLLVGSFRYFIKPR